MKHIQLPSLLNEKGSILLAALVILAALSFLGGLALTRSHFELKLSQNDKVFARLKSLSTAVALTTAQRIENLNNHTLNDSDLNSATRLPWLTNVEVDPFVPDNWYTPERIVKEGLTVSPNSAEFEADATITDTAALNTFNAKFKNNNLGCEFQAIDVGVVGSGESLSIGNNKTKKHSYYISGYCRDRNQYRIVKLGTRKEH